MARIRIHCHHHIIAIHSFPEALARHLANSVIIRTFRFDYGVIDKILVVIQLTSSDETSLMATAMAEHPIAILRSMIGKNISEARIHSLLTSLKKRETWNKNRGGRLISIFSFPHPSHLRWPPRSLYHNNLPRYPFKLPQSSPSCVLSMFCRTCHHAQLDICPYP